MRVLLLGVLTVAAADRAPPRVAVDLDAPASSRWTAIASRFNASIRTALETVESTSSTYHRLLEAATLLLGSNASHSTWLPEDEFEEVLAFARVTKLPVGKLVALAALYDLTASGNMQHHACTSVVAQGGDAGATPVHGRNLDYPLHAAMLNITAIVDWRHDGRTVFSSVSFVGVVNFNTVVRVGAWSLSQDERDQGPITSDWFDLFLRRRMLTFSAIRTIAQTAATYEEALAALKAAPLNAPSYFVLAGAAAGEGAVVTRDRDPAPSKGDAGGKGAGGADVWPIDAGAGRWYVLETNYDHWGPTSVHDDRRAAGERAVERLGREDVATPRGILSVLSDRRCNNSAGERAVLNSHTAYSAVMVPAARDAATSIQVLLREPARSEVCDPP